MPNSIFGLIILIVFFAPGFVLVIEVRRKNPLFARSQSQVEFVLWGCLASLGAHLVLLTLISFVVLVISAIWHSSGVLSFFSAGIGKIGPQKVRDFEIWRILLCFLYVLLASGIAYVIGFCLTLYPRGKKLGTVNFGSHWLDVFPVGRVSFVRAWLKNGYIVMGNVASVQTDPEAIVSGKRDIELDAPIYISLDDVAEESDAEKLIINTSNIDILEIISTEELSDVEGESHGQEEAGSK